MATVHPFERELRIRFAHCDPAGIVFFPQYLVMINNLVEDWVTECLGVPYAELLGRGAPACPPSACSASSPPSAAWART